MEIANLTPIAALTVGQFKELLSVSFPHTEEPKVSEILNKKECSDLTGYSTNTINKMICERQIPHYKSRGRVLFRCNEINEWMLSNRVETTDEYLGKKDGEFVQKRRGGRK
ncbi:DNA binding domain, excisionase family [Bacteroidales bacterium Barb4]|nr:DNA binding domain, excisionase family [Bacteroidales bacterium Barb4]